MELPPKKQVKSQNWQQPPQLCDSFIKFKSEVGGVQDKFFYYVPGVIDPDPSQFESENCKGGSKILFLSRERMSSSV